MEKKKIVAQDLEHKFKSKRDLYNLLSIDLGYYLPPFEYCPLHFLRAALSGDKRLCKKDKIVNIVVPRFQELSVENVWKFVKDFAELIQYFPGFKANQLPNRDFMFAILATFKNNQLKSMIKNARKYRAVDAAENENDYVYIRKDICEEINNVMTQKITKERAAHLLKRKAKLSSKRNKSKVYPLTCETLEEENEEHKEEVIKF